MQTLNDTIDHLDIIDIYWTFHPKTMNFTFFSSAHGTFSRIDHILGNKPSLSKFKKIEIIPSIFSDHNAVRLDLNYRRKNINMEAENTLLNNQQIREEIKKEIKICIEMNENENTTTQNLWDTVKAVLRGRFIAVQLYLKKQDKSQINNLDQIRLVARSCPTLCDPMDCSLPGSSLYGILQARALEWVAIFLLQGIFLTQESNPGLPHSRKTL